ncbi:MAG: lysophospholipid acyltransferase family protein [bacterium]|nr:lysophospholipid acyltransferase family protein [bacterium]
MTAQSVPPAPEVEVTSASAIDVPALRGSRAVLAAMLRLLPPRAAAACGGLASELAADRLSPLELCRRLGFEGWENLHAASEAGRGVVLLLPALGSRRVALRALVLYRPALRHFLVCPQSDDPSAALATLSQGSEVAILLGRPPLDPMPARLALASGAPAVLIVALPERRGTFHIRASPPIAPVADDTIETLTQRYLRAIEDQIRRQPEIRPWSRQKWSD